MAKRYRNHRVPAQFDEFLKDFSYKNKIDKKIDIYRELVKDQQKTDDFLRSLFNNRRGSAAFDIGTASLYVLITLAVLFTAGLIFVIFSNNFSGYTGPGASQMADLVTNGLAAVTGFDIAAIIIVVGFMMFLFGLSYFFNSSPFFFSIFLALAFIMMLVSIPVVNGVADYLNDPNPLITENLSRMPAVNFFVNNWMYVIIAFTCSSIIGFGARPNREDGAL